MLNERARVGLDTSRSPTPTSAVERGKRREACAGLLRRKEDGPDVKAEVSVYVVQRGTLRGERLVARK